MADKKDRDIAQVELSRACVDISKINFSGNIIPKNWFKSIKFPSGKADLLAINILAEVVYWYRLVEVCDEATGKVIGYKRRFKADKLQRSYQSFADMFGVSKRQIKVAIDRLKDQESLKTEFRTVHSGNAIMTNVLFLEPVPKNILNITHPQQTDIVDQSSPLLQSNVRGSYNQMQEGPTIKCRTYTKITNKNTNTTSSKEEESSPPSHTKSLSQDIFDPDKKENIIVLNEEDKRPDGVSMANGAPPSPQEIVELWNSICGLAGLPKVVRLTKQRSGNISRRIREYGSDPVFWEGLFRKIIQTPFLMGNNDRGWRADIDFVFGNDTNISKILEGKYEGGSQGKNTGLTGQIQGVYNAMEKIKQRNEEGRTEDERRSFL